MLEIVGIIVLCITAIALLAQDIFSKKGTKK